MNISAVLSWFRRKSTAEVLIVVCLTTLAAGLRFYAIEALPPGLYHDEAFNGLDAWGILQGQRPLFFEANNGREPLFIYLLALGVRLWGRSPGALRFISAAVGTLVVPVTYFLGRTLYDRRTALLSALLACGSVWMLNLSRVAFRAGLLVPLFGLAMALLWSGMRQRRLGRLIAAGLFIAAGLYTYIAARFIAVTLLFFIIYSLLWQRQLLWWRGWIVLGLVVLLAVSPLAWYLAQQWGILLERTGQVSIWNPTISGGHLWQLLARQIVRAAGLFFVRGDFIPRHNVPLRSLFSPVMVLPFLWGTVVMARRWRREPAGAWCLIWIATMLGPTILAEGAPHMLRAVGIAPMVYVLPAIGLRELYHWLRGRRSRALALGVVALALGTSLVADGLAYGRHLRSEAVYYNFEAGTSKLAAEINRYLGSGWTGQGLVAQEHPVSGERQVYVARRLWRNSATLQYLAPTSAALHVLPKSGLPEDVPSGPDVLLVLWPYEDNSAVLALLPAERLIEARPGARERGDLDSESRWLYYTLHTAPLEVALGPKSMGWQGGLRLAAYEIEPGADDNLQVTLYWQSETPLERDLTLFVHVWRGDTRIGQQDGPPAYGYYGTSRWRPGDTVLDAHDIALQEPWDPATCHVEVGWYHPETLQPWPLVDAAGHIQSETSARLGP